MLRKKYVIFSPVLKIVRENLTLEQTAELNRNDNIACSMLVRINL